MMAGQEIGYHETHLRCRDGPACRVRTIGIARAKAKIGLQNLAYNIRRLVTLERMATA